MRRLFLLLPLCGLLVALVGAAPAEGKKGGKTKGAPPAGAVDTVAAAKPASKTPDFKLTSPAFKDGESLPAEFTGDGESASPPLAWSGVPKGARSLVLIMHHLDPEGRTKIYWLVHDIDPQTTRIAKNATGFGQIGVSTVHDRVEYAPPHSKGPGEKQYVLTLFALSARPDLAPAASPATVGPLLAAMKGKILGAADLKVRYARPEGADDESPRRPEKK